MAKSSIFCGDTLRRERRDVCAKQPQSAIGAIDG